VEDDDGEYIFFAFLAAIPAGIRLHYYYRRNSQFSSSRRQATFITNAAAKSKKTQVFVLKNSAIQQIPRFDIQEIDIKRNNNG
jgi:hypothetical protein